MELPDNFIHQRIGLEHFSRLVEKGAAALVEYFKAHPEEADSVLIQSSNKRHTPSTFIEECNNGYRVGWFETDREFVKEFSTIEEAASDYLLFSFGVGRF